MSIKQQLQPFQLVSCWYHVLHKTHTCIHFLEKVKNSSPKKLSANCWSTVSQLLANSRPTVVYHLLRKSEKVKNSSPKKLLANCWSTVGQLLADSIPTVGRQTFWGALLHFYPFFSAFLFHLQIKKLYLTNKKVVN